MPESLIKGAKLEIEDLDLQGMGLYTQQQKEDLIKSGAQEDDFFLGTGRWFGGYWMRKSDEGVKWRVYDDPPEIFHWALLKKKE